MLSPAPFPSFSPARTLPVLGLVCVLALTACSDGEEAAPELLPPSAISPDRLVTCEDPADAGSTGDCGEPGSVRWSLPLEGEYMMYTYPGDSSVVLPRGQATSSDHPYPGATVHEGVLYHHDHEQILAVDLESAEPLWTEEVDPDRNKSVLGLHPVGDRLVMVARDNREWMGLLYLLDPAEDGLEWEFLDLETHTALREGIPANDTHFLVTTERNIGSGEDSVYALVAASTGRTEWTAPLPGRVDVDALTEDTLFTLERSGDDSGEPDLVHRVDLADGRVSEGFPVPEGLDANELTAVGGGGLFVSGGAVMDTGTGERLWTLDGGREFHRVVAGDPGLLHLSRGDDHWLVDARTGEEVDDRALGFPPESYGVDYHWYRDGVDTSELDPHTPPVTAEGPNAERFEIDTAAGIRHLASYQTEEGEYVGVYRGCAPDGVRELGWESPTGGPECVAPRLFAVDYGVAGTPPQ
ncbi:outer membrane protein assembly factor BamB family protein [Nocardiopsis ganjiahuensis]|uniref:outer membrane protein assembly factor BamB family protein n=1 Tax=Nocardiopsis ganjiahuensis TaxID=239984 RepID=UPI00034BD6F1|nr:PQQ-binding-like beta-propeller repeat protein [Nocardiopsis ganjiahuensis]